jgi:hypothetical protein
MKKTVGFLLTVIIGGALLVSCTSTGSSSGTVAISQETISGSEWEFSVSAGMLKYTFVDDLKYMVTTTGGFAQAATLAQFSGDYDGTGTYFVEGTTVTLKPSGGIYISVREDGEVILQGVGQDGTFNISLNGDKFKLDGITLTRIK